MKFNSWSYRNRKFCSKECKYNFSRVYKPCLNCKKIMVKQKSESDRIFCSKKCYAINKRIKHQGMKTTANGYIIIRVSSHPKANKRGDVYEHRLVMEKKIGRYLEKEEVVHHINGDKTDNRPENLKLFATTNEHTTFHLLKGDLAKR